MSGDDPFVLHVHGLELPVVNELPQLKVKRFEGKERMNGTYKFDIEVLTPPQPNFAERLLSQRASFFIQADPVRTVHGLLSEVELLGFDRHDEEEYAIYRLRLVPRMYKMSRKRKSRIFKDKSVVEVVRKVLHHNHLAAMWLVHHEHPRREYCVQYEETDEEFVNRLLAEAGIFYFFIQPNIDMPDVAGQLVTLTEGVVTHFAGQASYTGELLVFADEAAAYFGIGELPPAIQALTQTALTQVARAAGEVGSTISSVGGDATQVVYDLGGPDLRSALSLSDQRSLQYSPNAGGSEGSEDLVREFALRKSSRSNAAAYRVFDPRRPLHQVDHKEPGQGLVGRTAALFGLEVPDGTTKVVGESAAVARQFGGAIGEAGRVLGGWTGASSKLEVYEHHSHFMHTDWQDAPHEPKRMLRSQLADQWLGTGKSICPQLSPGRRFRLVDHPVEWVNKDFAVVEAKHKGKSDHGGGDGEDSTKDSPAYQNEFVVVPAHIAFVPPRPRRRNVQSCESATVIAASSGSEVATHHMGEVKIRFHWERNEGYGAHDDDEHSEGEGHRDAGGPSGEGGHSGEEAHEEGAEGEEEAVNAAPEDLPWGGTCWVRVLQPWAGTSWGTQFMPRVGMEVIVAFEGGDPDRPIVLGSVYNGIHPSPFPLPEEQTRSGIRTSSIGGDGHNELSFEDRHEQEQIYLKAQRDLEVKVQHDRRVEVDHDDHLVIAGDQHLTVRGRQHIRLEQGQEVEITTNHRYVVDGRYETITRGDRQEQISGDGRMDVEGSVHRTVHQDRHDAVHGDWVRRVEGSVVDLVQHAHAALVNGRREVHSSGPTVISSDEEIVLQVGRTTIRLTDERAELTSPEIRLLGTGAQVTLAENNVKLYADGRVQGVGEEAIFRSSGAGIEMTSEVSVEGSQILLNSPNSAEDSIEEEEEQELTNIVLRDQEGNPIAYARYRIELEDGSSMSGVLDEEGQASVLIEGSGQVSFPDFGIVDEGPPQEPDGDGERNDSAAAGGEDAGANEEVPS
ncbi:MAG: contractile injection system protein, VgrG/Pvc8 family [Myxococcota bacterium]